MAEDIARLGVAVDSSSAVGASRDLEALAVSGDKADAATRRLQDGWKAATFSPTALFNANKALREFKQANAEAAAASSKVDDAWKRQTFSDGQLMKANQSLANFRREADAAAQSASKVDDAWKRQTFSTGHLMKANQSLINYRRELQQSATAATASANAQVTANKVVAESHHQVSKAAVGYTKSAKEMAFATRNLPAQFTDIAVSLQAGQNPLTVLLQQGGQLKDMFGGIGPAARALGGYIMGLVNPYTVAAAAAAVLTLAFVKGDDEARKFNATLVMQGNTLGVTTDALVQASEEMARFGQTQGASAAALSATAASGKIFGDSIQTVAQAALNMERETGQAIDKTVSQFASLADEPVAAALKLDEQYKYLTVTTYEQIRALEDQGDSLGAAQLAMDALADTINSRTSDIEDNLGTLQKSWRAVAGAAKWAWDQMLNIGRESSVSDKIIELNDKIREINNPSTFMSYAQLGAKGSDARNEYVRKLQDEIRALQVVYNREQTKARQDREMEQGRQASIELAEAARRGRTNAEKRVAEHNQITERVRLATIAAEKKSGQERIAALKQIARDEEKARAEVNKRLADPKEPKARKSQEAKDAEKFLREQGQEYDRFKKALQDHSATLDAAAESQDNLTSFEKWAAKATAELNSESSKLTATQREAIKAEIELVRVKDALNTKRQQEIKYLQISSELQRNLAMDEAAQARSINQESLTVGRGREEAGLEVALEEIRYRAAQDRMELEREAQKLNQIGTAQYLSDLQRINDAEARMSQAEIQRLANRKEAMGDWRNGMRSAMEDIRWSLSDTAGQTRDSVMTMFSAMNGALSNFAQTGKMKIKDFATVVIAELIRIALTVAASKILTSLLGGPSGPSSGAGFSVTANGGVTNGMMVPSANGNVFMSGMLSTFARGGLPFGGFGGVMHGATLTTMANGGTALMAEERPEAVVPLKRGPNGKLGVASYGGGGGGVSVTTYVNIDNNGNSSSRSEASGDEATQGKKLGDLINAKVRQVLVEERRQGGILWGMVNGR